MSEMVGPMTTVVSNSMFEGQHDLRWSMERLADEALDRAGVELDPRGFLVGLPLEDAPEDLPIAIEPARRAFALDGLGELMGKADGLYLDQLEGDNTPDAGEAHEHYLAALREGCRRQVVVEALTQAARFDNRTVCVGMSVVVGHYRVFPVLAVLTEPWEELATLSSTTVDGLSVDASFHEAVVNDVLRAASRELDRKNPTSLIGIDAGAILRSAADSFVNSCVARSGQDFAHGMRDALDAVSAQTYEGRAGLGSLILAEPNHPSVHQAVTFDHRVPLTTPRAFRKALEMSGAGLQLLADGREVFALGRLEDDYDVRSERCFTFKVVGNGSWELWHANTPYLRVDNGQPSLPRDVVDADIFADTVRRVFPESTHQDAKALWDMANACIQQSHGTMLVVHPDAVAEGERLLPQAYTIEPTRLGPSAFTALTKIDGAVLVSPDGVCAAVGVILDGAATGTGDVSRGARYNSAIRYLAGAGKGSMVIIVSEDGRIDILPKLARRIRRSTVQRAVDLLVAAAEDHEDYETFARLDNYASKLEFYFDAEQCEAVNDAREAVEQHRWATERVRMQVVPIAPHPAMDDSYFIASQD